MIVNATEEDVKANDSLTVKLKKSENTESSLAAQIDKYPKELSESMTRGNVLADQVNSLGENTGIYARKIQSYKAKASMCSAWITLYETSLEGIDTEHTNHDVQRCE